jgi:hypothetical protein
MKGHIRERGKGDRYTVVDRRDPGDAVMWGHSKRRTKADD